MKDTGWVVATGSQAPTPLVNIDSVNPGASGQLRQRCITIAVASASRDQCGDLQVAHALSSWRTRGKTRTPVLLYNQQTARPYPLINAIVTKPSAAGALQSMSATLSVNGVDRNTLTWTDVATWQPGASRRIAIGFDASTAFPTSRILDYSLRVRFTYSGGTIGETTVNGTYLLVNRASSWMGAGWWMAGLDELYRGQTPDAQGRRRLLGVGGDGSARIFTASSVTDTLTWIAPALDHPDTIVFVLATPDGPNYQRHVKGGSTVIWGSGGGFMSHVKDPFGANTVFSYMTTSAGGRVRRVMPPANPAQVGGYGWDLTYSGGAQRLTRVSAPLDSTWHRFTTLEYDTTANLLTRIVEPDGRSVSFRYDDPAFPGFMTVRIDRRGGWSTFGYDGGRKLSVARTHLDAQGGLTGASIWAIRPVESLGLPTNAPLDTANAFTQIDGPRTDSADVTAIWLDRFGAPTRIRDAHGSETYIQRADGRWPALPTRVQAANGLVTTAGYDARGNIAADTVWSPLNGPPSEKAITRYAWDQSWDAIQRIVRPMGDSITFGIDPANGNRLWQQDGRGVGSRVQFLYDTSPNADLLRAVQYPAVRAGQTDLDSLEYDSYGNLAHERRVTIAGATRTIHSAKHTVSDGIGRVMSTCSEITIGGPQQCTAVTQYDPMDRPLVTTDSGPAINGRPAQKATVTRQYDEEGNLRRVDRTSWPDPLGIGTLTERWGYDRANRMTHDSSYTGAVLAIESRQLDAAGNVQSLTTRRGHVLSMIYDARNQLLSRSIPMVSYAERKAGIYDIVAQAGTRPLPSGNLSYPRLNKDANNGLTIASDVERFAYDAMGRDTLAINGDAIVHRRYYLSGLPRDEVDSVRTYAGSDFTKHAYALHYDYDLNGRRTTLTLPATLTQSPVLGVRNTIGYTYDQATGFVRTVTDPLGKVFTYGYDAASSLSTLTMPGGISEGWTYDGAGRLVVDTILNASTAAQKFL
ncbi:MAG: RHS repeat domain-containing protein, partial [Gemmatimonadales bacterium]